MTIATRRSFLRRSELFRDAPKIVVVGVADVMTEVHIEPGEVVCREGDEADAFFVIQRGTLAVHTDIAGTERELGRLFAGDWFGEVALLGEGTRTATVRAVSQADLLRLSAADLHQLMKEVPAVAALVDQASRRRRSRSLCTALEVEHRNLAAVLAQRAQITIGRAADNDLIFGSLNVAEHHAVLRARDSRATGVVELVDLGSGAGTFVNGKGVSGAVALHDGDQIVVGDQRFLFDRSGEVTVVERRGIRIDLVDVRKTVRGDRTLLHDVTLSVLPGELVAIVGGSGAGKTTLLDAMAGLRPATSGTVLYNGRNYYDEIDQYRHVLGYVPQDDIIHGDMPLRRTLRYAARLRLPRDTTAEHIEDAIDARLADLGLTEREGVVVSRLSGGQRKRASIAIELLSEPRVLYLDEPTSGLDPATDRQMMQVLRRLADDGRTVVLTTHATKNVGLCDRIVVLARDGFLAYAGPPEGALAHFEVEAFDEIYDRLEQDDPGARAERFDASAEAGAVPAPVDVVDVVDAIPSSADVGAAPRRGGIRQFLHQWRVLAARNAYLHARPQNLMPMVMQPVTLTLLILALFRSGLWAADTSTPNAATQILFTFDFVMFLFGLLFSAQEMVRESSIFRRERTVDVRVGPYVLSKVSFLAPALAVVAAAMSAVFWATGRLPDRGLDVYAPLYLTLVLTGWAGMAMSLLISSTVRTSQQATDMLTPWIAPQVLFAGALFSVPSMGFVGRALSDVTAVRWSFEASSHVARLKDLFATARGDIGRAMLVQYRSSFTWSPVRYWGILTLFILVPLGLAAVVLARRTRPT